MSPILSKYDDHEGSEGGKCCVCGGTLRFPFLDWHGSDIKLCGDCCRSMKRGFVADLIQVIAILDMQALGYPDATLIRHSVKQLNAAYADEADKDDVVVPLHRHT